ncbi:MAG: CoA-binding protein [Candidatus Helarchaeota archaeon]|nr:CoA-binding protein [Candidatus Helarchaeota archaeon]
MDKLFYPKSIAYIGATKRRIWNIAGILERGYKGNLYIVSEKEQEILGIKCYQSISELPDKIDLTVIAITKKKLKDIIKKCIEKKFYTLHIFSAGLGEYDKPGIELECGIHEMLKNSDTRAIGPNCMGVYSTGGRISYNPSFSKKICTSGCVAFVSHSGDLTSRYVSEANYYGINFSAAASIGNTISLKFSDFIEYFCSDEKTDIITGYFEGFSQFREFEGRELLKVLKENKKPILILRGGVTEKGAKTASSHTGSISSNSKIWRSVIAQTGIINTDTYEELMDSTIAFYYCKDLYPEVNSLILITWSGGTAALGVDRIINLGVEVPEIQDPARSEMQSMISIGSVANPLDLPWIEREEKYPEICKIAIREPYVGGVIIEAFAPRRFDKHHEIFYNNIMKIANFSRGAKKPFLMSLPYSKGIQREKYKDILIKDRIPVFPSVERAARAFSNLYKYKSKFI